MQSKLVGASRSCLTLALIIAWFADHALATRDSDRVAGDLSHQAATLEGIGDADQTNETRNSNKVAEELVNPPPTDPPSANLQLGSTGDADQKIELHNAEEESVAKTGECKWDPLNTGDTTSCGGGFHYKKAGSTNCGTLTW
eukprot:CAMPEP_0172703562 /NCGR_PEP_ID=MMETSP1074-20121228/37920_1 /TAXON_ID=2916 /ORGANISM="Ceratium fusus, Strain PA161109" /LENGTH=141 /DNA_ID=CAMNT_0013525493 /DNA_START=89 /DNA_END=511 /DNA_ORIENTATION=-